MLSIISKIGVPIVLLLAGMISGIGLQQKVFNPKPVAHQEIQCPDCNCPQSTVSVQPFEVEKIKNLKAFSYSPQFTGQISVAGVDSSAIKRYIDEAVIRAFEKHVTRIAPDIKTESKKRRR